MKKGDKYSKTLEEGNVNVTRGVFHKWGIKSDIR
jgi:hypothetical protein